MTIIFALVDFLDYTVNYNSSWPEVIHHYGVIYTGFEYM